jgi:hypothetical protein
LLRHLGHLGDEGGQPGVGIHQHRHGRAGQRRGLEGAHQVGLDLEQAQHHASGLAGGEPDVVDQDAAEAIGVDAEIRHHAGDAVAHPRGIDRVALEQLGQLVVGVLDRRHRAQGHVGGDQHGAGQLLEPVLGNAAR